MKPETFIRAAVAFLLTLAVLVLAIGIAWTQTDDTNPLDGSVLAVAVIDAQMEQTRRQVVFYDVDQAKIACADAAWRPAMHHAVRILEADPGMRRGSSSGSRLGVRVLYSAIEATWRTPVWGSPKRSG